MSSLKKLYYNFSSIIPMNVLQSVSGASTLFPYHHTVSSEFLPHIKHLYNYKNETQFIHDIDVLLKSFKPASVDDVQQSLAKNNRLPERSFLLSFDDGFREVHDIVAPILEKKGIPAIFFINPAFIGNKLLFYRCKISLLIHELLKHASDKRYITTYTRRLTGPKDLNKVEAITAALKKINQHTSHILDEIAAENNYSFASFLQEQQPFLTGDQVISLHKKGFSIGAHSLDHPYYPLLNLDQQIEQTEKSCRFVNELTGTDQCTFSFPHSDSEISKEFFSCVDREMISLFFGIQNQKAEDDHTVIQRFNAERPEISMDVQLKGLIFLIALRKLAGKNKVIRH